MKVKALQKMYYGKQDRMPGDIYDMDDREATEVNVLVALGKIEILKSDSEPAAKYSTTSMQAEPEVQSSSDDEVQSSSDDEVQSSPEVQPMTTNDPLVTPGRRSYRRRDMRAQR